MNRQDDIFNLFRDNQHKIAEKPSSASWRKLESRLDARHAKQKASLYKYAAVFAVIIASFAMITAVSLINDKNIASNEVEAIPVVAQTITKEGKANKSDLKVIELNEKEISTTETVTTVLSDKNVIGGNRSNSKIEASTSNKPNFVLEDRRRNEPIFSPETKEYKTIENNNFGNKQDSPVEVRKAPMPKLAPPPPSAVFEIAEDVEEEVEESSPEVFADAEVEKVHDFKAISITPPKKEADISEKSANKDFLESSTPASDFYKNREEAKEKEKMEVRDALGYEERGQTVVDTKPTKSKNKAKGKKSRADSNPGLAAQKSEEVARSPEAQFEPTISNSASSPVVTSSIGAENGILESDDIILEEVTVMDVPSDEEAMNEQRDKANAFENASISIEDFKWMIGDWNEQNANGVSFEKWKMSDSKTLIGKGYFISNSDTTFVERMSIKEIDNEFYYLVAIDGHQNVSFFKLKSFDGSTAIFENPNLNFPNQIIIEKKSANAYMNIMQNAAPTQISTEQQEYLLNRNVLSNERAYRNLSRSQ